MTAGGTWQWSDAWFFVAVYVAGSGVEPRSLRDVINAADSINKAVLEEVEVEAVEWLESAQLRLEDAIYALEGRYGARA